MKTAENESNVVKLKSGAFLNELECDLKVAEPWSEEKTHVMYLLAQCIRNPNMALSQKMRALSLIAKYTDVGSALAEAGFQRTVTVSQLDHASLAADDENLISWKTSR